MAGTNAPSGSNLILGAGALYFDLFDTSGNKTGELHLGNCDKFELTPSTEMATKKSGLDAAKGVFKQAIKGLQYDLAITGCEFNKENLALLFLGSVGTLTQSTASVTGETLSSSVKKGRWYACTKRGISAVTVKAGVAGSTAMTLTTDYTIDATTGRIYVVPGGGIADGDILKIDYTYATISKSKISAGTTPRLEGFMRYIADNAAGPNHEIQMWRVVLNPDGAIGFITDDFADWTLKGTVQYDAANHPTSPYFDIIEL